MATRDSLWRTCTVALCIALLGNVLLYRLSTDDDWFANVIAAVSGLAALGLILSHWVRNAAEPSLGLSFIAWVANGIEFATEEFPEWDTKVRQCSFYAAFALISLGCWLRVRDKRYGI